MINIPKKINKNKNSNFKIISIILSQGPFRYNLFLLKTENTVAK